MYYCNPSLVGRNLHKVCFLECDRNRHVASPPWAQKALRQSSVALLSLWTIRSTTSLLATFSSSHMQPAKASLPTTVSAWSSLTTSAAPTAHCFGWQLHVFPFDCRRAVKCSSWQSEGGMFNNCTGVTKSVPFNGKFDSFY